jgi:hypothetical protein
MSTLDDKKTLHILQSIQRDSRTRTEDVKAIVKRA